jgi:predicted metal-dependent hydrolase
VRLVLSVSDGLVVVVPEGFDLHRVPDIVAEKKAWVERAAQRLRGRRSGERPDASDAPPDRITLGAINEEWTVEYQSTEARSVTLVAREGRKLSVSGAIDHSSAVRAVMVRWLKRKAEIHLVPWIRQIAVVRGFAVNRVMIRAQRTRWGSCSQRRNISLNLDLLFLRPDLVEYVFIHELVHTQCLNHSPEFWRRVAVLVPDYKRKRIAVRKAWIELPQWLQKGA